MASSPGLRSTSPAVGYGAALATLLAGFLMAAAAGRGPAAVVVAAPVLGVSAACVAAWFASNGRLAVARRMGGLGKGLLAQLVPVIFLSAAYPLVGEELSRCQVAGLPLPVLLLATSLTVPWLSQIVCTPLFTALSAPPAAGEPAELADRFLGRWPLVGAASVPVAGGFAAGIGAVLGWPTPVVLALGALFVLNTLFAQSLVVCILQRDHLGWAIAWLAYAVVFVAVPSWWFLPPVAGAMTQVLRLVRARSSVLRLMRTRGLLGQFAKGGLIGSVLWSDKLFFFLAAPQAFNPLVVFLAVLPAVLAYNYYFVRLAPRMDELVGQMRSAMENDPLARSTAQLRELAWQVENSTVRVSCLGAVLTFVAVLTVVVVAPAQGLLYAAMTVAAGSFLVITILLYKLDYIGRTDLVCRFAGAHLAAMGLVFLILTPSAASYLVAAALSLIVLVAAARSCLGAWRVPEYSLFWRHATGW